MDRFSRISTSLSNEKSSFETLLESSGWKQPPRWSAQPPSAASFAEWIPTVISQPFQGWHLTAFKINEAFFPQVHFRFPVHELINVSPMHFPPIAIILWCVLSNLPTFVGQFCLTHFLKPASNFISSLKPNRTILCFSDAPPLLLDLITLTNHQALGSFLGATRN